MKPWRFRLAPTALAFLCLTWAGCGGSDVPDPSADPTAATDEGAPVVADAAPGRGAGGQAGKEVEPAAEPTTPAEPAAATPPPTKGDSSATSELLALSNANSAPAATAGAEGAGDGGKPAEPAAAEGGGPPGAAQEAVIGVRGPGGGSGGYPASSRSMEGTPAGGAGYPGGAAGYPGAPGGPPGGASGYPGAPGGGPPGANPGMSIPGGYGAPGVAAAPGGAGAPGGGRGGMVGGEAGGMVGGPGGGGAAGAGGIYALQYKAASDFLKAAAAKNKDELAELVALRAPQEAASEKNKKLFSAILDQSIGDSDLDEISKAFEGYQIIGHNEAKSSGRLGIILGKSGPEGQFQRTITVRKEAKGWRVADVSAAGRLFGPSSKARKTSK